MKSLCERLTDPCINLAALERRLNIPRGALEQFTSGRRGLSQKHRMKLIAYFRAVLNSIDGANLE